MYRLPWISSRFAGSSGSFGGAGVATTGANPLDVAAGEPLVAGAATLPVPVFAETSGFTAAFVAFAGALSAFPPETGLTVFSLAFAAVADDASEDDATAGSACGCESAAGFAGRRAASFFAAEAGSDFPAGADGIMDSILSFSTSSYP